MSIRENFGFNEGQNIVVKFEDLLGRNGINVKNDSDLESKFLSVFDVLFSFEKREIIEPDGDYRQLFRDFSALYDLALKVISVEKHKDFCQLIPHLNKLNDCSIAQNGISKISDQDANKIIELYVASLCMRFCGSTSLDNPQSSKGDNPDVIAEINGEKWGFACKTIHTKNAQTIFESLEKAISQIEKSPSTTGIPVINLKNIIDHDAIWPKGYTFLSLEHPCSSIKSNINSVWRSLVDDIGIDELERLYSGKKSIPGILFIAQSTTSVFRSETKSPTATRINMMSLCEIIKNKLQPEEERVFCQLNHFMQLPNVD